MSSLIVDRSPLRDTRYLLSHLCAGHINHSLFWRNLAPSASEDKGHGGKLQEGPLKKAICERWGSVPNFTKEFNTTTAGIQGSGWGWLVRLPPTGGCILFFKYLD